MKQICIATLVSAIVLAGCTQASASLVDSGVIERGKPRVALQNAFAVKNETALLPVKEIVVEKDMSAEEQVYTYTAKAKAAQAKLQLKLNLTVGAVRGWVPVAYATDDAAVIAQLIAEVDTYTDLAIAAANTVEEPLQSEKLLTVIAYTQADTQEIVTDARKNARGALLQTLSFVEAELAVKTQAIDSAVADVRVAVATGLPRVHVAVPTDSAAFVSENGTIQIAERADPKMKAEKRLVLAEQRMADTRERLAAAGVSEAEVNAALSEATERIAEAKQQVAGGNYAAPAAELLSAAAVTADVASVHEMREEGKKQVQRLEAQAAAGDATAAAALERLEPVLHDVPLTQAIDERRAERTQEVRGMVEEREKHAEVRQKTREALLFAKEAEVQGIADVRGDTAPKDVQLLELERKMVEAAVTKRQQEVAPTPAVTQVRETPVLPGAMNVPQVVPQPAPQSQAMALPGEQKSAQPQGVPQAASPVTAKAEIPTAAVLTGSVLDATPVMGKGAEAAPRWQDSGVGAPVTQVEQRPVVEAVSKVPRASAEASSAAVVPNPIPETRTAKEVKEAQAVREVVRDTAATQVKKEVRDEVREKVREHVGTETGVAPLPDAATATGSAASLPTGAVPASAAGVVNPPVTNGAVLPVTGSATTAPLPSAAAPQGTVLPPVAPQPVTAQPAPTTAVPVPAVSTVVQPVDTAREKVQLNPAVPTTSTGVPLPANPDISSGVR